MKFSGLVLASLATSGAAFTSTSNGARTSFSKLSAVAVKEEQKLDLKPGFTLEEAPLLMDPVADMTEEDAAKAIQPGRYNNKDNSIALPFLLRPNKLDGSHAGDYGFDPLGFTETEDLYTMQEAEIRHARLAMLAVVGWPLSELIAPEWMLQSGGRAPSVLNGFNPLTFLATVAVFGGLGYFEFKTSLRSNTQTEFGKIHRQDMSQVWNYGVAGDYNWDPLNLYNSIGDDAMSRKGLRDVELSHGRSAMLGISTFAAWEFLTGHAITDSFGMFFHPNLALPALVFGYTFFNAVYDVENNERYVLQISKTSEGEAYLETLKLSLPAALRGEGPSSEETMANLSEAAEKAQDLFAKAQKAYASMSDSYLEYSTQNMEKKD